MKLIKIKIYCSCTSIYNIIKQTSLINLKSTYQNKKILQKKMLCTIYTEQK